MHISKKETEDRLWGERALKADKDGYLGPKASAVLLKKLMKKMGLTFKQLKKPANRS